jgi:hypothetical protein
MEPEAKFFNDFSRACMRVRARECPAEYVEAGGLMSCLQTRSIGFEDASLLASSPRIFWITVVARITFFVLSGLLAKIRQHPSWTAGFFAVAQMSAFGGEADMASSEPHVCF